MIIVRLIWNRYTRDAVSLVKTHGEKLSEVKWMKKSFLGDGE
ncbi:MAG: hypothetical protein AEth_01740 [Candidatus Argoarchaeum ethanivorans]|uniref:Uncharacterized protein n=1 Tax=Candidatus Argoarchaeum ethanivorans TaxID=2608793 RepID=A0A8B3S1L2_9EURY|nr:MAG: hypothetical protein AEth_01740 [Candidatus Argoarchaeum ethanivorans]